MKHGLFLVLLSLPLLACQRTPPADPALLDTWIEKIVSPENRHLRIDVKQFDQEVQKKIAIQATLRLKAATVKNYTAVSPLAPPSKRPSSYFDVVNFLLDMNADIQQAPDILLAGKGVRSVAGLATEYACFTRQLVETGKCPTQALVKATLAQIIENVYENDDEISCVLMQGLLVRAKELSKLDEAILQETLIIRRQKTANKGCRVPSKELAQAFAELEKQIKEKTP